MAASKLDLVRSMYAAWERDDYRSTSWADPEIEFVLADGPDPGSWRGIAGMTQGWRTFLSSWDQYRIEVEEYRELDAERVLVLVRLGGRGKTSGLDLQRMEAKGANLVEVRSGKVVRLVLYFDRDRGLAELALGS
jgi:ketosteroid isomerase-like protein